MSWQDYVTAATGLGFSKVTIIDRKSYSPVGYTSAADIATAWMDGEVQVNENQELLDDWASKKKLNFCFYGKRFNILQRDDEDGKWLVGLKGKEVCVAHQFNSVWFIVYGESASKSVKKDDAGGGGSFKSAPDAFNKIMKNVWDGLTDAEL